MSSDNAGVSRSAVIEEGRSNMPRIAPAHSSPRVLSRSRASRRNSATSAQAAMDSSCAGGLVSTRTTSGIDRLAGRVGGHRQVQADVEQPPLGHGDLRAAHDHHQGLEQRQPAGADGLPQPVAVGAVGLGERGAQRSGVERVERVQTTPDPPDPPAQVADQGAVLALGVAGHHRGEPERDQPGQQPLDDGRLADARLALHPHAGVGHQALAQPLRGIQADRFGGVHVPADRHPGRDGAGGDREREQPAHLRGGGLPDGAALDVGRPPAVGDRPAPGPRDRAPPVHRTRVRRTDRGRRGGARPPRPGPAHRTGVRPRRRPPASPTPAGAAAERADAAAGRLRRRAGMAVLRGGGGRVIAAPGGRARRG